MYAMCIVSILIVPLNRWHSNQVNNTLFRNVLGKLTNNHYVTSLSNIRFSSKIKSDYRNMGLFNDFIHNLILVE